MQKLFQSLLLGSAIIVTSMAAHAADKSRNSDVSISAPGVNVDVGLGGNKGLKADADASIGGSKGVNANVDASIGGNKGLEADVDATIGDRNGVQADVDLSLGGNNGLDTDVSAVLGDDMNVEIGLGTDNGKQPATTSNGVNNNGTDTTDGRVLTAAQRQALNAMSSSERKALLKRCNSVGSGGYDPALVQLCKLLRMSASR